MGLMGLRRRWTLLISTIVAFILFAHVLFVNDGDIRETIKQVPLPGKQHHETLQTAGFGATYVAQDKHPISQMMAEADERWREYDESRSRTFRECLARYRRKYGRHPPPGFDEWYKFARLRYVHNIDDFDQIQDDLRPFWSVQPRILRSLSAHMWETGDGIASIHIRNGKVAGVDNSSGRTDALVSMLKSFLKYLPDMDIPVNELDQPRVLVPWDDMQAALAREHLMHSLHPVVLNEFSTKLSDMYDMKLGKDDPASREDPGWVNWAGKQYMDIVRTACPPGSHANHGMDVNQAELTWKDRLGGIVKNFNLSTDLCTIGPELQDMHGFLFSSGPIRSTKRLVPIFSESKLSVSSDILFPSGMYWTKDDRYTYNDKYDKNWDAKDEKIVWRGTATGGVQREDNWQHLHRQRFVQMMNGTVMQGQQTRILTEQPEVHGEFENFRLYEPANTLQEHGDVGFTEAGGCVPDCKFYDTVFTMLDQIALPAQFRNKFLVDIDGHYFSGQWRAYLQSKSLSIKATIFREWHDSRLFAWRHFVPMDNRYDDIFSILTYFMGTGDPETRQPGQAFVHRHDLEAKRIALQGREWAHQVLRKEDIEIYMFRLLLEYGRLMDENRDRIGYSGDGSELKEFDEKLLEAVS